MTICDKNYNQDESSIVCFEFNNRNHELTKLEKAKIMAINVYDLFCFIFRCIGYVLQAILTILLGIIFIPLYLFFSCICVIPLLLGIFFVFWLLFSFGTF